MILNQYSLYSMYQILENKVTLNIIIGLLLAIVLTFCCCCICRSNRRDLKKKTRITPGETLYVNPMRIKQEKILRII